MVEVGIKIALRKCIFYSLFFGMLACLFFVVFAGYCSSTLLHGKVSNAPIYIMAISLPFTSLSASLGGYFTGVRRVSKTSIARILTLLLQVFLTYYFLYSFASSNVNTVCIYLVLATTISSLFEFIFTYILYVIDRKKLKNLGYAPTTNYFKKVLHIALPVAIASYVRSSLSTIQQLIIPFSLARYPKSGTTALAQYGLINGMAMQVIMFPCIIITSCASLLIPEFARYNIKQDYEKMNKVIAFIFKFTSFFSIFVIGVILTFTEELCYLIYHNLEITNFLIILSPLIILIYLDKIIDAMLRGLDKQVGVMFCNIFDLFLTIVLIYTLVPMYGIYGYIAILGISELFNFTVSLIQLYKVSKFKFDYMSYIVIPFFVIISLKILFDAIDKFIEYNTRICYL